MDKELQNRERRLRYWAKKKGLRIIKDNYRIGGETYSGYLITRYGSALVLTVYNHYNNLISIEDAERFVAEY